MRWARVLHCLRGVEARREDLTDERTDATAKYRRVADTRLVLPLRAIGHEIASVVGRPDKANSDLGKIVLVWGACRALVETRNDLSCAPP